ncbi:MFS transporter [Roseibacillus persicicus]|uniref:Glucarate transporter n=1 Tax=Roseibacillus persicicus TaxID=454148 RepID=A0A918TTA0_9BACT|nr:MFS transporter [Roseibacillus persicicus]GHC62403.1 glucarate transporter [Roseibacillus persicicus]
MKTRHLLVCLTFVLSLLLYIDRACISVAKDNIVGEFNLSDKQFGWILSIFTLGYALAQTPSGAMADKYGPRRVLTIIVALWSALTAITGAAFNYVFLLVTRFVFGAAEAGAFPSFARATFSWFPVKERGLVTGINFSASRLGAALALPLMVGLIEAAGWRGSFYILGAIGVVIAVIWWFWFRDEPADHKLMSDRERDYILENRQKVVASASVKLKVSELLSSGPLKLAMVQYFCSNFTFFFCLGWLFPYVKETYNLTAANAGLVAAVPLLGGAVGNCFSGWLVDRIYSGKRPELSRRVPAVVGFLLAALGLLVSVHMETVGPAIFFLTIAVFGADMTLSPSWSYCVDIGGRHAGAYSGTMNMAGNIGSFATALAFPYLKDAFGVEAFFYVAAVLNVVAIVTWTRMKSPQLKDATA